MNELDLFVAAYELPDGPPRRNFLDGACAADPALRRRLSLLLGENLGPLDQPPTADGGAARTLSASGGLFAGAEVSGRYTLVEPIGRGGMGEVWRARQTSPVRREVALKLVRAGIDSRQVLARFDAERQALALMDHPNVASVFDGGLHDGRPFFVMELVAGAPITTFCDAARLGVRERLGLFAEVCDAIGHAHQKGLIHRDVKPGNVLVGRRDGRPAAKVIDFGVAKATRGPLTDSTLATGFGCLVGTPQYMSPEQATFLNADIDTRSDVYSLGVLLYELLTGSPPVSDAELAGKGVLEVLRVVREDDPPRPSSRPAAGALPRELDWLVLKALAKDRTRRYQSAGDLAADVRRYLADDAVLAHPPGRGYLLKKFLRRHRTAAVAAGLVLTALTLGLAGTSWGLVRAERAAAGERQARERAERGADVLADVFLDIDTLEVRRRSEPLERRLAKRLLAAAAQLDEWAADDPVGAARLQVRLGGALDGLGDTAEATALFEKALAALVPRVGPDDRRALEASRGLASCLAASGDGGRARAVTEEALRRSTAALGADDLLTLELADQMANVLADAGEFGRAIELQEKALALGKARHGPDHPLLLSGMVGLADNLVSAGRPGEAVPLLEDALERQTAALGPDDANGFETASKLAGLYGRAGRHADALPIHEKAFAAARRTLGRSHPDTRGCHLGLAAGLLNAGRPDEALASHRELVDLSEAAEGRDHPSTVDALAGLGECLRRMKRLADARPILEEVLRAREESPEPDRLAATRARIALGSAHAEPGHYAKGAELLEEGLKRLRTLGPPDSPEAFHAAASLGLSWNLSGRSARAAEFLAGELRRAEAGPGPDDSATLTLRLRLCQALRDAGRPAEALAALEPLLPKVTAFAEPEAVCYDAAGLFRALRRPADEERWQRAAVDLTRATPKGARHGIALGGLGTTLLNRRRWDEAEPILREALAIREATQPGTWMEANARALLGSALLGRNLLAEARPLLLAGYEGLKTHEASMPPPYRVRLREALDRLIEHDALTGRPDRVKTWQDERVRFCELLPRPKTR